MMGGLSSYLTPFTFLRLLPLVAGGGKWANKSESIPHAQILLVIPARLTILCNWTSGRSVQEVVLVILTRTWWSLAQAEREWSPTTATEIAARGHCGYGVVSPSATLQLLLENSSPVSYSLDIRI